MNKQNHLPHDVVRTETLGPGVTRYFYGDGESTDVCFTNFPHGPMDTMPDSGKMPDHMRREPVEMWG